MGPILTIPKRITHGEELVLLRKDEYERLVRQPTFPQVFPEVATLNSSISEKERWMVPKIKR